MEEKRAILLAGVKHCGKSSIGRELARILTVPFLDADEELLRRRREKGDCPSIRSLFQKLGEAGFRRAEAELLTALLRERFCGVLALGGGAVGNPELPAETLERLGTLVWIDVPDETAYRRILAGGLPPFLAGAPNPMEELARINASRRKTLAASAEICFRPAPDRSPAENACLLKERLTEQKLV